MTMPAALPEQLAQSYSTPLSAQAIGDRVDLLNANGHSWMPADMQTTLASSPTSDSTLLTTAHTIKQTLAKTWDGFAEAFDDPVLHKQPTTGLTLTRLLSASLGPIPIEQTDLVKVQQSMQKLGFGADLASNGVWGADWNDAYNQYSNDLITRQLAGDKPGSTSTGNAAHHWYQALEPAHALDALVGYVKSIPGDVRSLAADVASATVNIGVDAKNLATNPIGSLENIKFGQQHEAAAKAGAAVESLGRQKGAVTPEQYEHMAEHPGRVIQDVGLVLSVMPIVGQAARATGFARTALAEGISEEAAARSTGVIAKSFGGLTAEDAASGVARRGVLNSKVFTNIPLLGQVGPTVGRLADSDGLYYRARTMLATPYKYPAVRIAGDIGQRTMLTGGALNAGAQLGAAVGGATPLTNDIQDTGPTDLVDRNINRIVGTPFEHPFTDAINSLGFILHGPLGDASNSTRVGDAVQRTNDATGDMLGKVGLYGIYQRAIQGVEKGALPSIDDLIERFGSEEYLDRFIALKTADLSAAHYAQRSAQADGLEFGAPGYRDAVGQHADAIWADAAKHTGAIRELIAQDGGVGLMNRFMTDMVHTTQDGRDYTSNAIRWMRSGDLLTDTIRNGDAKYLFGANGKSVIASAQDDFDFGLGQDNPMRLSSATRRQYNAEVSNLMGRVRSGVTAARNAAVKGISAAQDTLTKAQNDLEAASEDERAGAQQAVNKARGRLVAARQQQRKIEEAFGSNLTYQIENELGKLSGPHGADAEWSRVASDVKRLRTLVQPALGKGEKFNLLDTLASHLDPDALYTSLNGAPRPSDAAIGSGDWMRETLPHDQGVIGLGRVDTKSVQEATNDLNAYESALASSDPEETARLVEELKDYGFDQFGLDARNLGVFDDTPQGLIDALKERAKDLASDVFLTDDAPQRLRDAVQRMAEHGYKPMLGSHIGHAWDGSLPPIGDIDGAITRRRRAAGVLGLDPTQVTSRAVGQNSRIRVLNEMQREADSNPKVRMPARTTADTVMAVLEDKNLLQPKVRAPERLALGLSKPLHNANVKRLAEDRGVDLAVAREQYEQELVRAVQIRDIPRKEAMHALTTPGEFENGATWGGMDKTSAALLLRAAQKGYTARPNYLLGLASIEDWGRAGFGVLGHIAHAFPDSGAVQAFANAPNELVALRNRVRFTLSPFYDLRRVAKANFKMSLDGVSPILNPLKHLIDNGQFTKAHEYLRSLIGEASTAGYDDADRYLHQQSMFGLYNSRHYEAYFAWQKHLAGATDEEIKGAIHKVFEYGSTRTGGRSALERSVNTVFFPFSFEKTLIRNTGMYLLDHPQQALLVTGAMDLYQKANQHEAITDWVQDHLPVLQDMQKLNAFAHGISPGEFGGINAPLANLLMPQVWSGKDYTKKNLEKAIPIWNDFGHLAADLHQQEIVAHNTVQNALSYAIHLGKPRGPLDPYLPMETTWAQRRDAEGLRNKAILAFTSQLDYNAHQSSDATKIRFADNPELPPAVQGQVVSRTAIGNLVKRWFPAYDPSFGQKYAVQQQAAANAKIAEITAKDPARGQSYAVFVKLANSVGDHLNKGDYDTAQAAEVISQFRNAAAAASETDPDFYSFYKSFYAWEFGPLEEITKP